MSLLNWPKGSCCVLCGTLLLLISCFICSFRMVICCSCSFSLSRACLRVILLGSLRVLLRL